MSSITGQIGAEHLELFALEFGKIAKSDIVYALASKKIRPVSTKHGYNVYVTQILDEFIYGSDPTVTYEVIWPLIKGQILPHPGGHKFHLDFSLRDLPVPSHRV